MNSPRTPRQWGPLDFEASEPAEPTARQATNPRVGMFARVDAAIDAFGAEHGKDGLKLGPRTAARIAITTLDEDGLLADPAQTTEQHAERLDRALWLWAEEKWRREQLLAQREQWWEHVGRERAQLESERDERQARIDEIADVLGRAPGDATSAEIVEIVRTAVAVKGRRRDEAMELRARIDAVTATCEAADVMVRMGMATSTLRWETAKAVLDDVRAALVGDQGKHLGENQAKSGGSEALTSGNSWANRDLDLSGAALRAVEEADDAAGDLP